MKVLRKQFGIPETVIPFALLSLDRPVKKPEPSTGFYVDKVHYDKY